MGFWKKLRFRLSHVFRSISNWLRPSLTEDEIIEEITWILSRDKKFKQFVTNVLYRSSSAQRINNPDDSLMKEIIDKMEREDSSRTV